MNRIEFVKKVKHQSESERNAGVIDVGCVQVSAA